MIEEIVIGRINDEATVTAEGEAESGNETIVAGESPVVDDDDIVDVVDYVIVVRLANALFVKWGRASCRSR